MGLSGLSSKKSVAMHPYTFARFDASHAQIKAASARIPGGVSSNFRLGISPTPLVFERAEGAWLHDLDGNWLIDYYLGMGPMILGHSPECVRDAVVRQLDKGILYGGQSLLEADVAALLCELVPCAEKVRFAASGSEVVRAALRLGRAATGRQYVIKFEAITTAGWTVFWSRWGRRLRQVRKAQKVLQRGLFWQYRGVPGSTLARGSIWRCCRGTTCRCSRPGWPSAMLLPS
jgi:glutamate-1-semialdehyde 2,1-aminomutase